MHPHEDPRKRPLLTAAQLQTHFQLLPSAASNRLRKLHQMRVIRREEQSRAINGGREYLYMPLAAPSRDM